MRREVIQDCVQLSAWVFFTLVVLDSNVSRWLVTLGFVLIALQVLVLVRRVVRIRRERARSTP